MNNGSESLAPAAVQDAPAALVRPAPRVAGQGAYDYSAGRVKGSVPPKVLWCTLVLLLAVAAVFADNLRLMWLRWFGPIGYYSHGPLVFPISVVTAWLIVRQRGLPMESTPRSRRWGMTLIVGCIMVHLLSMYTRGTITFLSGFMLLGVLAGIMLYLGGFPMFRRLWFPLAFLAFMVPLPDPVNNKITFFLKMRVAAASTDIASLAGVPVIRQGSNILLSHMRELTVDAVCSGLKSLISLLAFATLFTYACRLRGLKRWILFLSAVPIALAANVVRITTLIIVANSYGTKISSAGGWVHDSMGYLVFVIAFCMMFLEEELLMMLPGSRGGQWITEGKASGGAGSGGAGKSGRPAAAGNQATHAREGQHGH